MALIYNTNSIFTRDFFEKNQSLNYGLPSIDSIRKYIWNIRSKNTLRVLNYLLQMFHYNENVDVSQSHIANVCGISRKQVNRIISDFKKNEIIKSTFRYKKTCIYQINAAIYTHASVFSSLFPILKRVSNCFTVAVSMANVPLYKKGSFNNTIRWVGQGIFGLVSQISQSIHVQTVKKEQRKLYLPSKKRVVGKEVFLLGVKMKPLTYTHLDELAQLLKLNQEQLTNFVCFPDEVIERLNKHIKSVDQPTHWREYVDKAQRHCIKNNIDVNWKMHNLCVQKYNELEPSQNSKDPVIPKIMNTTLLKVQIHSDPVYAKKVNPYIEMLPEWVRKEKGI